MQTLKDLFSTIIPNKIPGSHEQVLELQIQGAISCYTQEWSRSQNWDVDETDGKRQTTNKNTTRDPRGMDEARIFDGTVDKEYPRIVVKIEIQRVRSILRSSTR